MELVPKLIEERELRSSEETAVVLGLQALSHADSKLAWSLQGIKGHLGGMRSRLVPQTYRMVRNRLTI